MHTIKGSSARMEFDSISLVSHKLEDLFYFVRDKGMDEDYSRELFDLVLRVSELSQACSHNSISFRLSPRTGLPRRPGKKSWLFNGTVYNSDSEDLSGKSTENESEAPIQGLIGSAEFTSGLHSFTFQS